MRIPEYGSKPKRPWKPAVLLLAGICMLVMIAILAFCASWMYESWTTRE